MKLGKQVLAVFGELHPLVTKPYKLRTRPVAAELFLDALPAAKKAKKTTRAAYNVSDLPAVTRDFAFIVKQDVPASAVLQAIASAEKKHISNVRVFDVYQGEHVEKDHASIAVSVSLQPTDATFTDADITRISDAIIQQVTTRCDAKLRDGSA